MTWIGHALTLIAITAIATQIARTHAHITEHLDRTTNSIKERINMSAQDTVNTIVAQLAKAKTELSGRISDLAAQLEAAGVAGQIDLSALTEVAQALDDIVPDAVEPDAPTN